MSEEDLAVVEQASATAAEVTGSMMRLKLELDEKKRTVNMLQTALVKQTNTHICISSVWFNTLFAFYLIYAFNLQ